MRNLVFCLAIGMLQMLGPVASGQTKLPKYGDVKPNDFSPNVYNIDSSANAVVLFDIGSSTYEGDDLGGFSVNYERFTRMRILNRNAFDAANIKIRLLKSGRFEEKVDKLEACTYKLENGKVQLSKLDKSSIFTDNINTRLSNVKFALPNLTEGCIIDIHYIIRSPFERSVKPWNFQGEYPTLWSQYTVEIPEIFDYAINASGNQPFEMNEVQQESRVYHISDMGTLSTEKSTTITHTAQVTIHKWGLSNIHALKEEVYTSCISNYRSRLTFQLSRIKMPNRPPQDVLRNWYVASEGLLKDEDFGAELFKNNGWLKDELKPVTTGVADNLSKAKKIFEFIRDNMNCVDHSAIYLSNSLKKCYQSKSGSDADINLLLTAALISQGFNAQPVLLSTRDNGFVNETYPIMSQLNYVLCNVKIDNKVYNLDASYARLGFGQLHSSCYNGSGRIINKDMPQLINLSADSLTGYKSTSVALVADSKGMLTGTLTEKFSSMESFDAREQLLTGSKDDFFKQHISSAQGIKVTDKTIENEQDYEQPLTLKCALNINTKDDIVYLTPIFTTTYKENPFKAADRKYPVEMPSTVYENYVLTMDIPQGYTVEEMPRSARVNLNDNEGSYEYLITKNETTIQLRSTLRIKKATFEADDYPTLRDLFAYIVKKHSEQIVLKKIK